MTRNDLIKYILKKVLDYYFNIQQITSITYEDFLKKFNLIINTLNDSEIEQIYQFAKNNNFKFFNDNLINN